MCRWPNAHRWRLSGTLSGTRSGARTMAMERREPIHAGGGTVLTRRAHLPSIKLPSTLTNSARHEPWTSWTAVFMFIGADEDLDSRETQRDPGIPAEPPSRASSRQREHVYTSGEPHAPTSLPLSQLPHPSQCDESAGLPSAPPVTTDLLLIISHMSIMIGRT